MEILTALIVLFLAVSITVMLTKVDYSAAVLLKNIVWGTKKSDRVRYIPAPKNHRGFEYHCAEWLRERGYDPTVTPAVGDGNKDILVNNPWGERVGIAECKYHKKPVGAKDVKVLYATMLSEGSPKGWFFSLNGFSPGVYDYVKKIDRHIELVSGKNLFH